MKHPTAADRCSIVKHAAPRKIYQQIAERTGKD